MISEVAAQSRGRPGFRSHRMQYTDLSQQCCDISVEVVLDCLGDVVQGVVHTQQLEIPSSDLQESSRCGRDPNFIFTLC
eukprot:m.30930 g.30930  ORF g.30930 m.30930 type:complete len:79 (-) comp16367_c1_seq1:2216-2452(-)